MPHAWLMVWSLARKDWQLFFADRRGAALCFVVPILLATAFGLIFDRPSAGLGANVPLRLLLVDEDQSDATRALITDLTSRAEVTTVNRTEALSLIDSRRYGVAIVLPHGFGDRQSFSRPKVELLHHPLCAMESQWAEGVFTEVVMRRKAREFLEPLGVEAARIDRPFQVERTSSSGPRLFNSYSHSFAGMTLQYLLFWGMESGLALLREQQGGVWRRLRSMPVPLWMLLTGRAVATAGIAFLLVLSTFTFGHFVFGVSVSGSWVGFAAMVLAVSVLAATTGLLVAAIGGTEARARSICILAILTVSMLGGLWIPAFLLPEWVQQWSLSLPTTWAMRGMDGLTWQGYTLRMAWPSVAAVLAFALIFLVLAVGRFSYSEARRKRGWAI